MKQDKQESLQELGAMLRDYYENAGYLLSRDELISFIDAISPLVFDSCRKETAPSKHHNGSLMASALMPCVRDFDRSL